MIVTSEQVNHFCFLLRVDYFQGLDNIHMIVTSSSEQVDHFCSLLKVDYWMEDPIIVGWKIQRLSSWMEDLGT